MCLFNVLKLKRWSSYLSKIYDKMKTKINLLIRYFCFILEILRLPFQFFNALSPCAVATQTLGTTLVADYC